MKNDQRRSADSGPTVADALAESLLRLGVETIFAQSLPSALILAAERVGIRQLVYRTENAGGAMADGFARMSRSIGIVAAQNGPAAALLVPPLAEALKASVPVLALVQDVPRAARDRNAFQEVDHAELFRSCSKRVSVLDSPERLDDDLHLLLTDALGGRPGPVVAMLPRDVLQLPARGGGRGNPSLSRFPRDRPRPGSDGIAEAAGLVADARAPIVIAGGGVHLSDAAAELRELQESASLPVGTTTMGKGVVDERHELSLGMVTSYMGEGALSHSTRELIDEADVVVLIGTRTNENGTDAWSLFPREATYVHLDLDPTEIGRNYQSVRLMGDARAGLEDLLETLSVADLSNRHERRPELVRRIARARERDRRSAEPRLKSAARPLRPERVMAELDAVIDDETIVVADASYSTIWVSAFLTARRAGQRFLSPRGLAGLGWGLPLAIGAQVANPDAHVVCVAGDGGFAHCWSELETLKREALPVTMIVLNNGILGFQKHAELHKLGAHTSAVELGGVDHVAVARACGLEARLVDRPEDLDTAMREAIAAPRPHLLEIEVDEAAYPPITAWQESQGLADIAGPDAKWSPSA